MWWYLIFSSFKINSSKARFFQSEVKYQYSNINIQLEWIYACSEGGCSLTHSARTPPDRANQIYGWNFFFFWRNWDWEKIICWNNCFGRCIFFWRVCKFFWNWLWEKIFNLNDFFGRGIFLKKLKLRKNNFLK